MQTMKEITPIPDKTFPINVFFLTSSGSSQLIHVHWHEHLELVYITNGNARMQIDDKYYDIKKDDLVFVNSKQIHGATKLDDDTKGIAIVFNDSLIRNRYMDSIDTQYISPILNSKVILPNILDSSDSLVSEIRSSIKHLILEFQEKKLGYELIIKSELFRIFGIMIRHSQELHIKGKLRNKNHKTLEPIVDLLNYLEQNFNSHITVEECSKMVNMSPNYFCRLFKKITGKTLTEYVNILRVNKATMLLKETNCSVTEIATKVGFGSITYFGRVFRKYKNHPPSFYR
jgi:AraC family transcriptional activator of pobA